MERAPLPPPEPPLADALVALPRGKGDAAAIAEAFQDPEIHRFSWPRSEPYTLADAHGYLRDARPARGRRGRVAVTAAGGEAAPIGGVALYDVERDQDRASLGYWVAPAARGRGVATHAARLLARWAFAELGARPDRAHLRAGQRRLPGGGGALRLRARGAAALAPAVQGRPPRHRRVRPPAARAPLTARLRTAPPRCAPAAPPPAAPAPCAPPSPRARPAHPSARPAPRRRRRCGALQLLQPRRHAGQLGPAASSSHAAASAASSCSAASRGRPWSRSSRARRASSSPASAASRPASSAAKRSCGRSAASRGARRAAGGQLARRRPARRRRPPGPCRSRRAWRALRGGRDLACRRVGGGDAVGVQRVVEHGERLRTASPRRPRRPRSSQASAPPRRRARRRRSRVARVTSTGAAARLRRRRLAAPPTRAAAAPSSAASKTRTWWASSPA